LVPEPQICVLKPVELDDADDELLHADDELHPAEVEALVDPAPAAVVTDAESSIGGMMRGSMMQSSWACRLREALKTDRSSSCSQWRGKARGRESGWGELITHLGRQW
jgi:hypothetical protein